MNKYVYVVEECYWYEGCSTEGIYTSEARALIALKELQRKKLRQTIETCKYGITSDKVHIKRIDDGEAEDKWDDDKMMREHFIKNIEKDEWKLKAYEALLADDKCYWWMPTGTMEHVHIEKVELNKAYEWGVGEETDKQMEGKNLFVTDEGMMKFDERYFKEEQ